MHSQIALFCIGVFLCVSCARTERNPETQDTKSADAVLDSMMKNIKPAPQHEYSAQAFISVEGAEIFADSLLKNISRHAKLGDSLEVAESTGLSYSGFGYFIPGDVYKVVSLNGDTTVKGYIRGKQLGAGGKIVLTDNSEAFVIYRYLALSGETDEDKSNPGEILLVKESRILAKHSFTAYSDLSFTQVKEQSFQPALTLFTLDYGYPACGYTQGHYLFSWDGKILKLVEKTHSASDSGIYGHWSDWIFPNDSLGEEEHLVVRDYFYEVDQKENELENDTFMQLTGLRKYKYHNYNFTLVSKDTTVQNLR